jgi:hypothetical protein|nr:uncharacterized protein LOC107278682 [Oryza sativa Japonica Group]
MAGFNKHYDAIKMQSPQAIQFLNDNHPMLWSRAKFSELSKVDYINNNLSESFNNWIKDLKDVQIVDMIDKIRQKIVSKFCHRAEIASKMEGVILPSVTKDLNKQSIGLKKHKVSRVTLTTAEVTIPDNQGMELRYAVDLDSQTCSCRVWQMCGKPCTHAIAFITSIRGASMHTYVDKYFSVEKLQLAYSVVFRPIIGKHQWEFVDPGFKLQKPRLRRKRGRPRKNRIKASDESGQNTKHKCKECGGFGHRDKNCQGGEVATKKKRNTMTKSNSTPEMDSGQGSNDPSITVQMPPKKAGRAKKDSCTTSSSAMPTPNIPRPRKVGRNKPTPDSI